MILASGHRVLHFERIDSTNAEARRLAETGEPGPLWLLADEQTSGRGRLGRNWVSPPGNLYATFLFALSAGLEVAAQVSFVAALAVHDAIAALKPGVDCSIKWPNDVLIGGAKVSGILAEVVGSAPTRIAIGCGVNVAHVPKGTPYPVTFLDSSIHQSSSFVRHPSPFFRHPSESWGPASSAVPALDAEKKLPQARPTTSASKQLDPDFRQGDGKEDTEFTPAKIAAIRIDLLLQELDRSLSYRLKIWDEGRGFDVIREGWLARAFGVGDQVTSADTTGTFTSIAADGALVMMLANGTTKPIHSGEVRFAKLEALRSQDA